MNYIKTMKTKTINKNNIYHNRYNQIKIYDLCCVYIKKLIILFY